MVRRRAKDERGVALVEFALVLPMLLLVMVAIFEFGRVFNYWIDTTHLANEGARWAVVDRAPGNNLQTYLCAKAATGELRNGLSVRVEFDTDPNDGTETYTTTSTGLEQGDAVRVRAQKTYNLAGFLRNIPIFGPVFPPGTVTFKGTSVMRIEQLRGASGSTPLTYTGGVTTCT